MYAHIFAAESNYSFHLIQLLNDRLSRSKHEIYFGLGKSLNCYEYDAFDKLSFRSLRSLKTWFHFIVNLNKYDKIFIHYLAYDPSLVFWHLVPKKTYTKIVWIVWGADLYAFNRKDEGPRTRVYEFFRRSIIKKLKTIAAFVHEDFEMVKKYYQTEAKYEEILYPLPVNINDLNIAMACKIPSQSAYTNILIGNSGDQANFHPEMIKILEKYKSKSIQVYCPLSYGGSKAYVDSITNMGKEILGEKFHAMTDLLSETEYADFLASMDIAIMNHDKQQGLGNILALLYLGKTVYMRTTISSYRFFLRKGIRIHDINQLAQNIDLNFILSTQNSTSNKVLVEKIISIEFYTKLWSNLIYSPHDTSN